MHELRFEDHTRFTVEPDEQVSLLRSIGGHELRFQAAIAVSPFTEAGQILALEADLIGHAPAPINEARLGRWTGHLAYTPKVVIHRQHMHFPLTNLQLHAIEAGRSGGDVSFRIMMRATLPQATGFPGTADVTTYITVPRSRWEEQVDQVALSSAFEMSVPYPLHDSRRAIPGARLRAAQRLITRNEYRAAILEVRMALDWFKENVPWDRPGKKNPRDLNQSERWWRIWESIYGQASGAMHLDEVTKNFEYSRAEAETLLALAGSLLRNVPAELPAPADEEDEDLVDAAP